MQARAWWGNRFGVSLANRVIVITGVSAGVGRAAAEAAAAQGAVCWGLLPRGEGGLRAVERELQARGADVHAVLADMADWQTVDTSAGLIEEALGPIDVWVDCAMTSVFSVPFWEIDPAEYRRVHDVTYIGYVHGTRAALHRMRPRDRGTVVQVGSALAYRGIPLQSAYCGAKHAIQGFSESLRCELLHERSRGPASRR